MADEEMKENPQQLQEDTEQLQEHEGGHDAAGTTEDDEEMQHLQEINDQSGVAKSQQFGADIGGLLRDGSDVRAGAEVEGDGRRKGKWRGKDLADEAAIQFDFGLDTLDYKIQAMALGADLRIYVIFVICFIFFFLFGRDISGNHYFARAVKDPVLGSEIAQLKVKKFFTDISDSYEWRLYVLDVIQIQWIDLEYPTGGNIFLGALRFRSHRVRKDTCEVNHAIIPTSMPPQALECYGVYTDENQDKGTDQGVRYNQVQRFQFKACSEFEGGSYTTGQIGRYDCGGYSFEVPWWRPATSSASLNEPFPSQYYERVPRSLVESLYIAPALYSDPPYVDDLATRFAILETFVWNPTLKTFLSVKLYVEVAAGGLWIPNYQIRVFDIWTVAGIPKLVYDCFFIIFVLYYVVMFFADLIKFKQKEGKVLAFFFDTWNVLEMLNLVIFIVVFVFRFLWISECNKRSWSIEALTYDQRYPAELDNILAYYMMQVYLNSVNTVLTFLKLLKFFRLNDRLNVLTRTLSESQDSIIGVLFIFLLVVTAFAMTGHGLFGLGVWAFRSVDSSFSTLLQMLLGTFNYEDMKNENRVLAGFFFWSYIILALFCLLNFLIGVLMEAFAEISSTKTVIPLDTVLARTVEEWKKILTCANIKKTVVNRLRGRGREQLLQEAHDCLKVYRDEVYPEGDTTTPDDDKQLLYRPMLLEAIGEELAEEIGSDYIEYIWDDLVYEWDQSNSAQEAIEAHRNLEMTTRGVKTAIGKELSQIEGFAERLIELDKSLAHLVTLLDRK